MRSVPAFFLILLGIGGRATAGPLDDIFEELARRRAQTHTVHYQTSGTKFDTKFSIGEGPLEDHEGPLSTVVKLDFHNKRVLKRKKSGILDLDLLIYRQHFTSVFFDGSKVRIFEAYDADRRKELSDRNADVTMRTIDENASLYCFEEGDYPIFFSHGYLLSAKHPRPKVANIASWATKDDFIFAGSTSIDGIDCHAIRDRAAGLHTYEYSFSKDGYKLMRADVLVNGKLYVRIDVSSTKTEWGWVPAAWQCSTVWEAGLRFLEKYRVQSATMNDAVEEIEFRGDQIKSDFIIRDGDEEAFYRADPQGNLARIIPDQKDQYSWTDYLILTVPLLVIAFILIVRRNRAHGDR